MPERDGGSVAVAAPTIASPRLVAGDPKDSNWPATDKLPYIEAGSGSR